jgi:hypothetical protein
MAYHPSVNPSTWIFAPDGTVESTDDPDMQARSRKNTAEAIDPEPVYA